MTRLLGIDLGARRIGLAVSDPAGPPQALVTIRRARTPTEDAVTVRRIALEQGVGELVVGLPLEAAGPGGDHPGLGRGD